MWATETDFERAQILYLKKSQSSHDKYVQTTKEIMLKEVKEGIMTISQQIKNINKDIKL